MPHEPADPRPAGSSLDRRLHEVWARAAREGRAMPGEPSLAESLSTSRPAVREALVRLEERGYIRRRKGADTVVNPIMLDIPARFDSQLDKSELIASMGRTPRLEVVSSSFSAVTQAESEEFEIALGTTALRVTKLWFADDVPVVLALDSVPVATPDRGGIDPSQPVFDLALALAGEHVEWEIVWPTANHLSTKQARLMQRPRGEAALMLELTGVGRSGRTGYWASEVHLRGAFRYAMVRSVRQN